MCTYFIVAPEHGLLTLRALDFIIENGYDFFMVSIGKYFPQNDTNYHMIKNRCCQNLFETCAVLCWELINYVLSYW